MALERIVFVRKIGKAGRISIPKYLIPYYRGKIVKVVIEPISSTTSEKN